MNAEMILLYGVVAKAGIDLLQLGVIGWFLWRWGKAEAVWDERLDQSAARLATATARLTEQLAKS